MSEAVPEEIGHEIGTQIAIIQQAKEDLAKARNIEHEGARSRAAAEQTIRKAHEVIAYLLRGSVGEEFVHVLSAISKGQS